MPQVQAAAGAALTAVGPASVAPLLAALKGPSREARGPAELALRAINLSGKGADVGPALRALVEAINDRDALVRRVSSDMLGNMGTAARSAVPTLLRAHESRARSTDLQDRAARLAAGRALWQLAPTEAARADVTVFDVDTRNVLKEAWAAIPALAKAMQSEDVKLRLAVVRSLGKIGLFDRGSAAPVTGSPVGPGGGSPMAQQPGQAASPAVAALTRALKDDSAEVRAAAKKALNQIKNP